MTSFVIALFAATNIKSEMHERKTDIYPFKRTIYLCEQCNEKRERRDALKNVKRVIVKPFRSTSFSNIKEVIMSVELKVFGGAYFPKDKALKNTRFKTACNSSKCGYKSHR
jgi:hypothetical protein